MYRQAFSMAYKMAHSPLQHAVPIIALLHIILAVLAHPFLNVLRPSSTTLPAIAMTQLNTSNAKNEGLYLLLRRRHKKNSSKANYTARCRPRHHLLQVLTLLHHIQHMRIHYLSDCWYANVNAQSMQQQQGQSEGQTEGQNSQAWASSSQTQPAAPSTSTTPVPVPAPRTATSGAATIQS
ncbi:hypothetical protein BDR07DRAFT_1417998 [Suillus spraguei]|nr:hypothetical protein BDR07DRAFT_1417998 [Suillus spraguei]